MSVTTASLGSNSARITYTAAETLANIIAAVEAWLTAHGWALWDINTSLNRVYRALNKDGATYKYAALDYSTAGYLLIKPYESWNETSHVGTNLCYYSDQTAYAQRINLTTGGALNLLATNRYLIIQTNNIGVLGSSTGNAWSGCLEVSRDNKLDADNPTLYPPYWWTNGYLLQALSTATIPIGSFPRAKEEQTGQAAGVNNYVRAFNLGGKTPAGSYLSLGSNIPALSDAWSLKNPVWPIKIGTINTFLDERGRLFGIKVIPRNQGTAAPCEDSILIKCNADAFPAGESESGSNVDHWVISESSANGCRFAVPK